MSVSVSVCVSVSVGVSVGEGLYRKILLFTPTSSDMILEY